MLLANQLDAVLWDLLPPDQHTLLPEPYHPHAPLLRDAGLVTEPSAVRCIPAPGITSKYWHVDMLVLCCLQAVARAVMLLTDGIRDAFTDTYS